MKLTNLLLTMTFLTFAFQNCGEVSLVPAGENKPAVIPTPSPTPVISPTPAPKSKATSISVLRAVKASTLQTQIIGYDLSKTEADKKIFEFSLPNSNAYHNSTKDMNGDGTEDFYILTVELPQYTLSFYSGKTGQLLSTTIYSLNEVGTIFYVGLFDQDNEIDLVTINTIDKYISIYDLNKNLKRRVNINSPHGLTTAVIGDVDKDGVQDIHINARSTSSGIPVTHIDSVVSGDTFNTLWSHEKSYNTLATNELLFMPNKNWLVFREQNLTASIIDTRSMTVAASITSPDRLTLGNTNGTFYSQYKRNIANNESIFLTYCEDLTNCTLAELSVNNPTVSSTYIQSVLADFQITFTSGLAFLEYDFFMSNNETHQSMFVNFGGNNLKYLVYNIDKQQPVLNVNLENTLLYCAIQLKKN